MELIVSPEQASQRLDMYLSKHLAFDASRTYFQELIKQGKVTLNNLKIKPSHLVKKGDKIIVIPPPAEDSAIIPEDIEIVILYEDEDLIVIDKPSNMVVHPTWKIRSGTLVNALLSHTHLAPIGQPFRPGIVHRLDKDTSGVLVAAKTNTAYWHLSQQFKNHTTNRMYLALVYGIVPQDKGRIEASIGRPDQGGVSMRVGGRLARSAVTNFKVRQRFPEDSASGSGFTLLQLKLETGRTHQIRVHLSYLGYPLLGDKVYGKRKGERLSLSRQALHAYMLGFQHPISKKYLEFTSCLPQDMVGFINQITKGNL